jgi:hypothetical protein
MNASLLSAAVLTALIAAAHSVLGEQRIFRHLRRAGRLVPTEGGSLLREYQVRILWGAWHVMSALGLGLVAALLWLAQPGVAGGWLGGAIAAALIACGLLILLSNRGRHPAWLAFFIDAGLVLLGG